LLHLFRWSSVRLWKQYKFIADTFYEMPKFYANVPVTSFMLEWRWLSSLWIFDVLLVLFDTSNNVFKQQGVQNIDHVVDVHALRRVPKTAIFGTPTCTIASKLPPLLLLHVTPLVHITTVYLPKPSAITCARSSLGLMAVFEYTVGKMNLLPTLAYFNETFLFCSV
jgi:hypothetical protein